MESRDREGVTMPEKDPSIYAALAAFWTLVIEPVKAAVLASIIALLRVMYDGKEPRMVRRMLESALCGTIALGVAYGVGALGWPSGVGTFLGAAIGLFGADQVRAWGRSLADQRFTGKDGSTK